MIKAIITSITVFIFVVICILIFMTIMNAKNIENFYASDNPEINYELFQYPPEKPINISGLISSLPSSIFSGFYYQTFTSKNNNYRIDYSTIWSHSYLPMLFFDFDTNIDKGGAHFRAGGYNQDTGEYNATDPNNCPLKNDVRGDWISINLPKPTIIKKFGFIARQGLVGRAPGTWKLYGYNKGSTNVIEIDSNNNRLKDDDYNSKNNFTYSKNISSNNELLDSYLFIFTKAADSSFNKGANYMINFNQILLFGDR